jgi:hypothetical protein
MLSAPPERTIKEGPGATGGAGTWWARNPYNPKSSEVAAEKDRSGHTDDHLIRQRSDVVDTS